ncbi:MAG: ribosome maturation factor RimM [Solirubrobacteraceae bacterium]
MTGEPVEPETGTAAEHVPESVPAGRVGRPHGLDGSFYVTRPRVRLLTLGAAVTVAGRETTIVRRAGTEQRPIVRLEGIEDRTAAEELRGTELLIGGGDAPALGEEEWWAHELEGCEVLDGEQLLGTVSKLIELPSCEALEVRPAGGGEVVLVPLVKDAIRRVTPAQRRIEVDLEFLGLSGRDEGNKGHDEQGRRGGGELGGGK